MILEIERKISQSLSSLKSEYLGVVGHGIHLIEISRFLILSKKLGKPFEQYCFTVDERSNSFSGVRRSQFLAGRFAAKEAVIKAIGREKIQENSWLDIEIQRLPTGEPLVVLDGNVRDIAKKLEIKKCLLSISHTSSYAVASAIALGTKSQSLK
jgi:holo-[acyl-carrier protein] synthase